MRVAQMVAVYYKLKFRRARPQQVCPALVPLINPPWHASFPSAHSLESHLIARALSEVRPHSSRELDALACRIAHNREVAGVHYRSDSEAGEELAGKAFKLLMKDCSRFKDMIQRAQREPGGAKYAHLDAQESSESNSESANDE